MAIATGTISLATTYICENAPMNQAVLVETMGHAEKGTTAPGARGIQGNWVERQRLSKYQPAVPPGQEHAASLHWRGVNYKPSLAWLVLLEDEAYGAGMAERSEVCMLRTQQRTRCCFFIDMLSNQMGGLPSWRHVTWALQEAEHWSVCHSSSLKNVVANTLSGWRERACFHAKISGNARWKTAGLSLVAVDSNCSRSGMYLFLPWVIFPTWHAHRSDWWQQQRTSCQLRMQKWVWIIA